MPAGYVKYHIKDDSIKREKHLHLSIISSFPRLNFHYSKPVLPPSDSNPLSHLDKHYIMSIIFLFYMIMFEQKHFFLKSI